MPMSGVILPQGETLRRALDSDLDEVHRVRTAVTENRLTTTVVTRADYLDAIGPSGRGWVVEKDGRIAAFAIALRSNWSIWALFVDPPFEGRGYGTVLLDTAVDWLWSRGASRIWLNTERGTRAEGFYRCRGWTETGQNEHGEVLFERRRVISDEPRRPV